MTRYPVILSPLTCFIQIITVAGGVMLEHTVVFERMVRGRIHRFRCTKRCHTHVDIPLQVFYRAQRMNVPVDIETLIEQIACKESHGRKHKTQDPGRG
jgi:hypothetical protein